MESVYYKQSGKVPATFIPVFLVLMAIAIPVLSTIYIYLIYYIPLIYFNFLVTAGCGIALGFVAGHAAKIGKARNAFVVALCTLAAMVFMKYVQWAVYIPLVFVDRYGLLNIPFAERFIDSWYLIRHPAVLLDDARFINYVGVWGIGANPTAPVTGTMLLVVWVGEFIVMTVAALIVAVDKIKVPFSEESNAWYTESSESVELDIPEDFEALQGEMERGNFAGFIERVRAGRTNELVFLRLAIYQPPDTSGSEPFFLTAQQHTTTESGRKKKKQQTKVEDLFTRMAVDGKIINEILEASAPWSPPSEGEYANDALSGNEDTVGKETQINIDENQNDENQNDENR